jgi:hypothetical protein
MKTKTLMAMALAAAIGTFTTQRALAQEHKDHPEHKEGEAHAKVKVPDSLDGIWAEIHKHHHELADTVKAQKLAEVHHHAFAIRDLAKALPSKVPSEHRKHAEGMVKKVSQLAADLDKSGDANDQASTEANLKKLDAQLKAMEEMFGPSETAPHKH